MGVRPHQRQDGSHSWDAAEAALDGAPGTGTGAQAAQYCGGPQALGAQLAEAPASVASGAGSGTASGAAAGPR
jgi:hypothetical protein